MINDDLLWPQKGQVIFQAAWQSGGIVLLIFVQFRSVLLIEFLTLQMCLPCHHSLWSLVCFFFFLFLNNSESFSFNISTVITKLTFYEHLVMLTLRRSHNHDHTVSCRGDQSSKR